MKNMNSVEFYHIPLSSNTRGPGVILQSNLFLKDMVVLSYILSFSVNCAGFMTSVCTAVRTREQQHSLDESAKDDAGGPCLLEAAAWWQEDKQYAGQDKYGLLDKSGVEERTQPAGTPNIFQSKAKQLHTRCLRRSISVSKRQDASVFPTPRKLHRQSQQSQEAQGKVLGD